MTTTPKSKRPRIIDLDAGTVRVLAQHGAQQQQIEREEWGPDWVDAGYVFTREDGTPVHPDRLSNIFDKKVRRSGLPRIRLHDLRHTHATVGLQAGVPIKVMSEHLGHATPPFTMDIYQHVMPGMQAEAAAQIAALIAEPESARP
jgi:integrase